VEDTGWSHPPWPKRVCDGDGGGGGNDEQWEDRHMRRRASPEGDDHDGSLADPGPDKLRRVGALDAGQS
jgi:hypothetical protein